MKRRNQFGVSFYLALINRKKEKKQRGKVAEAYLFTILGCGRVARSVRLIGIRRGIHVVVVTIKLLTWIRTSGNF